MDFLKKIVGIINSNKEFKLNDELSELKKESNESHKTIQELDQNKKELKNNDEENNIKDEYIEDIFKNESESEKEISEEFEEINNIENEDIQNKNNEIEEMNEKEISEELEEINNIENEDIQDKETEENKLNILKETVENSKNYNVNVKKQNFDDSFYIPSSEKYFDEEIIQKKIESEVKIQTEKSEEKENKESNKEEIEFVKKETEEDKKTNVEKIKEQIKNGQNFIKNRIKDEFRQNILKKFGEKKNDEIDEETKKIKKIETNPKTNIMDKELEEKLIKERLYGDQIINKQKEKQKFNEEIFDDIDKKVIKLDINKVNAFLEEQRDKIYLFMEKKINTAYKIIGEQVKIIQNEIKIINTKEVPENDMKILRDKRKLITELTLINNKFITPKTRGLKRVKLYYENISIALKEYETTLSVMNEANYVENFKIITKSINIIKNNAEHLKEVFSLKTVEIINELQQKLQDTFTKMQLKDKVIREIERRKSYLNRIEEYKEKMDLQKEKIKNSDQFKEYKEKNAQLKNLKEELKKLSNRINELFIKNKDDIFAESEIYILSPILKLYIKDVHETLKNDLNHELINFLKKQMEINKKINIEQVQILLNQLKQYKEKNEELKKVLNKINLNTITQDEMDIEYKETHIEENSKKIEEELEKLQNAHQKLNIVIEKYELSKVISENFNINFLIS